MSSNSDRRLDRLVPALSAKERALLVLRHYKEGTEAPPAITATMPPHQAQEFNRLIRLMNAANLELACVLMVVNADVRRIDLKYGWLLSLMLCCDEIYGFGYTVLRHVQDPKLKREVRKLLAQTPGQIGRPVDLSL